MTVADITEAGMTSGAGGAAGGSGEIIGATHQGWLGETVDEIMHVIATAIEVAGVGIIVLGAVVAVVLFLRQGLSERRWAPAYEAFRANLGRSILLGLELLVAADIIGTVAVTPTLQNLGVLAAIVLIRTFLSISLEVEI